MTIFWITFWVIVAAVAGGCIGMIIMSAMCSKSRTNARTYSDRAKELLNEIVRLKEQEDALRSELERISVLYNKAK